MRNEFDLSAPNSGRLRCVLMVRVGSRAADRASAVCPRSQADRGCPVHPNRLYGRKQSLIGIGRRDAM